ncbi:MAG TPA: toll/interleukin-1 receptor domain-containing protein [Terriglobales bacterium]
MGITYETDRWLRDTYENHCFISWPHTQNPDITQCAQAVRKAIVGGLALSFHDPQVFLDESEITGGSAWEMQLRRALCKSMSMVAICSPMYYRPEHRWCGLEWAAMEHLSSTRLHGCDFKAIIPVLVRKSDPLPPIVSKIQYIDVSRVTLQGRRYFAYPEFRRKINDIVVRIEQIAEELWRGQRKADCDVFQFPTESAFSDYSDPAQRFPLVS